MFRQELPFVRLWRRLTHRYPFARSAPYLGWVERLYQRDASGAYEALKALGLWEKRLDLDQVGAYFLQLLALQERNSLKEIDPACLLELFDGLTVENAWRY